MATPANNNLKIFATSLVATLSLLLLILRLIGPSSRHAAPAMTPAELQQTMGAPVTAEQSQADFDKNIAHGEMAKLNDMAKAIRAARPNQVLHVDGLILTPVPTTQP